MRKYLLAAAVATVAIATPAAARDGSGYVGIEGGVLFPQSEDIFGAVDFTDNVDGITDFGPADIGHVKFKTGYDVDIIGGYDFGMFRLEGELGYKRAKNKSFHVDQDIIDALNDGTDGTFTEDDFEIGGHTSVLSAMINGLVDFGGNGGVGGYVGGGVGYASVKQFGETDGGLAWQLLAGVYAPVSDNIDIGLKYRYFRSQKLHMEDSFAFTGDPGFSDGIATVGIDDRFTSHSLLASLVYNFGAVAAPPPPPPVERGERGR
jgi:opacity protein-like surface antigen